QSPLPRHRHPRRDRSPPAVPTLPPAPAAQVGAREVHFTRRTAGGNKRAAVLLGDSGVPRVHRSSRHPIRCNNNNSMQASARLAVNTTNLHSGVSPVSPRETIRSPLLIHLD